MLELNDHSQTHVNKSHWTHTCPCDIPIINVDRTRGCVLTVDPGPDWTNSAAPIFQYITGLLTNWRHLDKFLFRACFFFFIVFISSTFNSEHIFSQRPLLMTWTAQNCRGPPSVLLSVTRRANPVLCGANLYSSSVVGNYFE